MSKIIATVRDLKTKSMIVVEQDEKVITVQYEKYKVVKMNVNQFLLMVKAVKKAENQLLRG